MLDEIRSLYQQKSQCDICKYPLSQFLVGPLWIMGRVSDAQLWHGKALSVSIYFTSRVYDKSERTRVSWYHLPSLRGTLDRAIVEAAYEKILQNVANKDKSATRTAVGKMDP